MIRYVDILRGLPGAGKTTYCQQHKAAYVVSADHYFMRTGKYRFDPMKLEMAHSQCWNRFQNGLKIRHPHIIVDNTNIRLCHIVPYASAALEAGYSLRFLEFKITPEESFRRNTKGIPLETLKRNHELWDEIPDYLRRSHGQADLRVSGSR